MDRPAKSRTIFYVLACLLWLPSLPASANQALDELAEKDKEPRVRNGALKALSEIRGFPSQFGTPAGGPGFF